MVHLRAMYISGLLSVAFCLAFVSLLAAQNPTPAHTSIPILATDAKDQQLEETLASRVAISLSEKPLQEFVEEELRQKHAIDVWIDRRALDDIGLGSDSPLPSAEFASVRLETALETILGGLDLTIVVRRSLLVITTVEAAEMQLETRVYPVADLVKPDVPAVVNQDPYGGAMSGMVGAKGMQRGSAGQKPLPDSYYDDFDTLIETITSTIQPDSWDDVGGPGTIEAFPISTALVMSQTRQVHRKVEALLVTLRKVKSVTKPAAGGRLQDLKNRFHSKLPETGLTPERR